MDRNIKNHQCQQKFSANEESNQRYFPRTETSAGNERQNGRNQEFEYVVNQTLFWNNITNWSRLYSSNFIIFSEINFRNFDLKSKYDNF